MDFGKRHDTTDNGLSPAPTCYSFMLRTCCGFATGKLV